MIAILKRVLRIIAWTVLFIIIFFVSFIVYITLTDYQPDPIEIIIEKQNNIVKLQKETFSIINWNIGYAGLGKEMDFFYDGGKGVRTTKDLSEKYLFITYRLIFFIHFEKIYSLNPSNVITKPKRSSLFF